MWCPSYKPPFMVDFSHEKPPFSGMISIEDGGPRAAAGRKEATTTSLNQFSVAKAEFKPWKNWGMIEKHDGLNQ